jgi:hypothetical protein
MSFSMTNRIVPVVLPSRTNATGLVFDSRVYTPLTDVSPVVSTDSGAVNMQHMAVVKDIRYTVFDTNVAPEIPVITNQPQSLTVTQGSSAAFTVLAGGTAPLSYQWRHLGTNIPGATTTTYTRLNAQPVHAGNYTVVITNSAGSVTSSPASLTVLVAPSFLSEPQSIEVVQGGTANFSGLADGNPLPAYQWRFFGTNLPGASATNLTLMNVQPDKAGNYTLLITNSVGTRTSSVATLTVLIAPTINLEPTNQSVNQGDTATFLVTAAGSSPLAYQWRFNGTPIASAVASNYSRVNVQPLDVGAYTVVITNVAGSITSAVASLTLNVPQPLLTIVTPGLLQWEGLSNLTYSVESRTSLDVTNWSSLGAASSTSNSIWFTNSAISDPLRIFRVKYP